MILGPRPSSSARSEASLAAWSAWLERPIVGASGSLVVGYLFVLLTVQSPGFRVGAAVIDVASFIVFALAWLQLLRVAPDRAALLRRQKLLTVIVLSGPIGFAVALTGVWPAFVLVVRALRLLPLLRWLLRTGSLRYAFVFGVVIVIVATIGFMRIEGASFGDSLYWSATTVSIGPQEIQASHAETRILTVVLAFLGLGFIGAIIGSLAAHVMQREQEEEIEDEFASVDARLAAIADRLEAIERRLPPGP